MNDFFDICFERLLGHEGGYVNNPNDPGGETNWGISKRSYPQIDISALTREQAKKIYRKDFWDTMKADDLPASISFQLFDFAVNSGMRTALRYMQKTVGVADDGYWGPISQQAAADMEENDMLFLLNANRLDFMRKLSSWRTFSSGWAGRIANNLRFAAKDNTEDAPWTR